MEFCREKGTRVQVTKELGKVEIYVRGSVRVLMLYTSFYSPSEIVCSFLRSRI
jgi:hypothetical protein